MTFDVLQYTPKEQNKDFFLSTCRQKSEVYAWVWTLRMWGNGGRNIKLDQAELIEMGLQRRDSGFSIRA